MKTVSTLTLILICWMHPLFANNPDSIVGKWITPEEKAIIQIAQNKGEFTGTIFRINPEGYVNGAAPTDEYNIDADLRSRSLEGIIILSGITYDKRKKRWNIKQIYEPERGKSFEGFIILDGRNELKMRGYVPGKKWLGKTEVWKRVGGVSPF